MSDDGLVHFLGRKDDMVKIRGHRVDPGSVSSPAEGPAADAFRTLATASAGLCSPSNFSGIALSQDELDALVADLGA